METSWTADALFSGMTARAFRLGTVLSRSWFWMRVEGCSLLYGGEGMERIDFANVMTVGGLNDGRISPPVYLVPEAGSTCFYVVRRVNKCGLEEQTLSAAVKVAIDAEGNIAELQPNAVFQMKVRQVEGGKAQLTWFYSPIGQKSEPAFFNIYHDNQTGWINYENPTATVAYKGRRFYSYETQTLQPGRYIFAVGAEDRLGRKNNSTARIVLQLCDSTVDEVDIVSVETI